MCGQEELEELRELLHNEINCSVDNLTSPRVLEISRRIDMLMSESYKNKAESKQLGQPSKY